MAPQKRKAPAAPASVAESAKSSKSTKSAPAVGTRSSARLRGLAPVETVAPPAKPKAQSVAGGTTGSQPAKKSKPSPKEDPADSVSIAVGDVVPDLQTLGSAITSVTAADHDESKAGKKIKPEDEPEAPPGKTLNQLLQESDKGVVLFTYPKASTPGCKSSLGFFCHLLFPSLFFFSSVSIPFCSTFHLPRLLFFFFFPNSHNIFPLTTKNNYLFPTY